MVAEAIFDVPRGLRVLRDKFQINYSVNGERYQEVLQIPAEEQFIQAAMKERDFRINVRSAGLPPAAYDAPIDYRTAFKNARKRGRYKLTKDDEQDLIHRACGRCELTGVPFSMVRIGHKRPYAPSLDRADSSGVYDVDNSRLLCTAANLALNEWGESIFSTIALGYIKLNVAAQHVKEM